METVFDWQMWAVLAAAPCSVAWLLGTLHGEARMRRAVGIADCVEQRAALQFPIAQTVNDRAAWALKHEKPGIDDRDLASHDQILANFALNDLRERTNHIRLTARLWDDPSALKELQDPNPIAEEVLLHSRGSINTLEEANTKRNTRSSLSVRGSIQDI
ncbi:MAG: hypothetical protein ABJP70_01920 [Erythrobacter sp.]